MNKPPKTLGTILLLCIAAMLFGLGIFFPNELHAYTSFRSPLVVRDSITRFGNVAPGERAFRQVPVFNNHFRAVQIQEITTSCGCTAATTSTRVIAPFHSGRISVSLMADAPGEGEKYVTLVTSRGIQQIRVTYNAVAPVCPAIATATTSATKEDQR